MGGQSRISITVLACCLAVACGGAPAPETKVPFEVVVAKPEPEAIVATQHNALAVVVAEEDPNVFFVVHRQIHAHPALADVIESLPEIKSMRDAGIDPGGDVDQLVSGCSERIGCFTLFEHHIRRESLQRFLAAMAKKSKTPAEWLATAPAVLRINLGSSQKTVAVFTEVNENLLLVSSRDASELALALRLTRGIEDSVDGQVITGRMKMDVGTEDGIAMSLRLAPDDALVGALWGKVAPGNDPAIAARFATRRLQRRMSFRWVPAPADRDEWFQFAAVDGEIRAPVRVDKELVLLFAAGLKLAAVFD